MFDFISHLAFSISTATLGFGYRSVGSINTLQKIYKLLEVYKCIGKSVIGSNIHDIEMQIFHSLWIIFVET